MIGKEQENNAELNQSSIIDVTEETPPEVVAAGYRTATGDSPTVLYRTSAPLMVDQMNTHSISIPNQTNRSQQIIDITRGLHVNETNDNGLNDYIPETAPFGDVGQNPSADGLKDVLVEHRELFIKSTSEEDPLLMEVRRGYVLVDSITIIRFSGDDLHSPLSIKFVDEEGVDLGGLRREFWSLLLHNISHSCYVTGKPGRQTFQSNYLEKKKKTFFHLGQLIALSIIQDGPGLPIFSDIVTDYIINGQTSVINPDDLPDGLKDALEKMQNSASDRDAKEAYSSIMDIATDIGFIVPITSFTKKHVKPLQAAFIESQISSCKDELNQFIEGLDTHQVMSLLRQPENRASARSLFSGRVKPITVGKFRKLLKFKYAEGNANQDQRATGIGFLTFLQATKGRATEINGIKLELKDVMMWLTGSTIIPAIGFHKLIDVDFADSTFVNTCALALTLKTQPDLSSEDAVSYYTELIINSQTFTKE
ncbi:uncharacterized protein LOC127705688 isoform X2 [Mytilus californianus]|uniref:uncharacterized protein LOC127705688 isoform X2 n=1 Tax=Mytilus californianus TaxID=6549 RepID=UPI0022485656|nr:uncharacterized protein LOC127705688 isoform X2 [Mytilus californianus]